MINGHTLGLRLQEKVQHPLLMKCLGSIEEIGHPGPGDQSDTIKQRLKQMFSRAGSEGRKEGWGEQSNGAIAGFPLNQLYFLPGSFGIWTSWTCQGYRIKERKSWYEKPGAKEGKEG